MICLVCEYMYDEWEDHECDPARVVLVRERNAAKRAFASGGRALTPEAKRAAVERLLSAWERVPLLRLGQFVELARARAGRADTFDIEDEALVKACEQYAEESPR